MVDLDHAAAEWLNAKAAGESLVRVEAAWREAERTSRRLERKIKEQEKRHGKISTV